ncbi:Hypothetical protein PHPALM_9224, partial [Phytophthora palmivora]
LRYTCCNAQVNAIVTRSLRGDFSIFQRAKGTHTHALSVELWEYCDESRRIVDPILMEANCYRRESGSCAKGILACRVKRTDTAVRRKITLCNVHTCCKLFGTNDQVYVDSVTQVTDVAVFQSARMKRLLQAYPEIVLMIRRTISMPTSTSCSVLSSNFFGKVCI